MKNEIFLPGLNLQLQAVTGEIDLRAKRILVVGTGSAKIAMILSSKSEMPVDIIVEDYENLMSTNLELDNTPNIKAALMDFEVTDFENETFDLIYAQASISNARRNKIVKELKRILKPEGIFCVGEIVKLQKNVPTFVHNIFDNSDLDPLYIDELTAYYNERKFICSKEYDFSATMKKFYSMSSENLLSATDDLTEQEKKYYKKLLKQINHESGAYLKQGADKFIGFKVLMLLKKD